MRRFLAISLLTALFAAPAAAFAQTGEPPGPLVDVVEIAGLIDRRLSEFAIERIDAAERDGAALLVFQVDSNGGAKISDGEVLPPLIRRIASARVPVAVFIGPRAANAAGLTVFMMAAADLTAIGPSARVGRLFPTDVARMFADHPRDAQRAELLRLAGGNGRTIDLAGPFPWGANAVARGGLADFVVPSVAELLRRADGRAVSTAAGPQTLRLPADEVTVRFHQPGPIRRLLHAFANPGLVYLSLLAGILLLVFELFQPGFGVAGVSGGMLLTGGVFGLTVLPARAPGLALLLAGLVLLTVDVARDELLVPTALGSAGLIVGSLLLFPPDVGGLGLSGWVVGPSVAGALIFFIPVMTMVRRARRPVATEAKGRLVGQPGDVRSVLNPEGFVWVGGELWRARTEDGSRLRVGEAVVVSAVEGTLLIVRRAPATNGASVSSH